MCTKPPCCSAYPLHASSRSTDRPYMSIFIGNIDASFESASTHRGHLSKNDPHFDVFDTHVDLLDVSPRYVEKTIKFRHVRQYRRRAGRRTVSPVSKVDEPGAKSGQRKREQRAAGDHGDVLLAVATAIAQRVGVDLLRELDGP